jgi:PAS domain S-box-containing protein
VERTLLACGWLSSDSKGKRQLVLVVEDVTRQRGTEKELKVSEERYRALMNAVPDLMLRNTADGTFVDCHIPEQADFFVQAERFIGKKVEEVLPPSLAAIFRSEAQQALETGELQQFEYPLEIRGEQQFYEARMVSSGQGEILTIVRDITQRKATEEGISAILKGTRGLGREFFRSLVLSLASVLRVKLVFIGRVAPDNLQEIETIAVAMDGCIVDNFRYPLKGSPCEQVVGKSLHVYPDGLTDTFPYDDLLWEIGVRSYAGFPLCAENGRGLGLLVAMHDQPLRQTDLLERLMTIFAAHASSELERMGAEEALSRSEKNYRKLFDEAIDGIVLTDKETGILAHCNTAFEELTGWQRISLVGKSHTLLYPDKPSAAGNPGKAGWNYLVDVREEVLEARLLTQSGRVVDVEVKGSLIELEGRSLVQAFFRDITDRKRAERQMRRLNQELERRVLERTSELEVANRELESFCYSVSHDLRAPLRGINGFSHMLLDEYAEALNPPAVGYLRRISAGCEKMGQLIDDLLTLSRVSRWEIRKDHVDLTKAAREIADELGRSSPERRVEWRIADGLSCYGDATLIKVVLENLLSNAWKYTALRPEPVIELGACAEGGKDCFFLRDNGAGFDMAYADKLFSPFERLHGAEFEGTGVGLATVQRIIERHGGKVRGEGVVDGGAMFRFTLPSTLPKAEDAAPADTAVSP